MSKNYLNVRRFKYIKKNFKYKIPFSRINVAKKINEKFLLKNI